MNAELLTPATETRFGEPVEIILREKGRNVWTISPDASVYDAIAMMSDLHVGALLVMTADRLDGIISERDYARKVILQGKQSQHTRVREIMTYPVVCVSLRDSLDHCLRTVTTRRVRHLPVLDGKSVVGIISIGDLVEWVIRDHRHTIHQLENYIAGTYPGA